MRAALILVLIAMLAPVGVADNLLAGPTCTLTLPCVTPLVCVDGTFCQDTTCSPAATCELRTLSATECKVNQTISGEACEQAMGFDMRHTREGQEVAAADIGVRLARGDVNALNLPNTWVSNSFESGVRVFGFDTGRVSLVYYESTIATSNDNEAQQYGVGATRDSGSAAIGRFGVTAGVILFDGVPEDCFVRTSTGGAFECSDQLP